MKGWWFVGFSSYLPNHAFCLPFYLCWDNFTSCSQDTTVATNSPLFNSRVSKQGHGKGHSEPYMISIDISRSFSNECTPTPNKLHFHWCSREFQFKAPLGRVAPAKKSAISAAPCGTVAMATHPTRLPCNIWAPAQVAFAEGRAAWRPGDSWSESCTRWLCQDRWSGWVLLTWRINCEGPLQSNRDHLQSLSNVTSSSEFLSSFNLSLSLKPFQCKYTHLPVTTTPMITLSPQRACWPPVGQTRTTPGQMADWQRAALQTSLSKEFIRIDLHLFNSLTSARRLQGIQSFNTEEANS